MYKFVTYPLGITVIAILSMITSLFLIAAILGYLIHFEQMWPNFCAKIYFDLTHPNLIADKVKTCLEFQPVTIKLCIAGIVYLSLFVVCSSILIWGGKKRKRGLLYPYLVTLIVITVLTVALCSYVARYSPYEIKALMGFCCTFLSFIALACSFAVCRHIHQIQMAEMILIASENKLDESFDSRSGLRSVNVKGNNGKLPFRKLPSIKEAVETSPKKSQNYEQQSEKKILTDSSFIVEQSIQTVSNNSMQESPQKLGNGERFQSSTAPSTNRDTNVNRSELITSASLKEVNTKLNQNGDSVGKQAWSPSADLLKFRSLRKKKHLNSNKLSAKRRAASATLIQSLVFKQNA